MQVAIGYIKTALAKYTPVTGKERQCESMAKLRTPSTRADAPLPADLTALSRSQGLTRSPRVTFTSLHPTRILRFPPMRPLRIGFSSRAL